MCPASAAQRFRARNHSRRILVLAYADGTIADTAENDADGDVTFEEITFDEEGTYTYIVYEAAGSDAHITYDDTVKLVVITVAEDDAGALSASAVVSVLTA